MKINSIIDLVKDLDTSRQTKNLNKLLIRILLHLQVEFSPDYFKGKIAILVNEMTQSFGELMSVAYRVAPKSAVIGTQTAGANGHVGYLYLPRGIKFTYTMAGAFYPEWKLNQRDGVTIDIPVEQTVEDIAAGEDMWIRKAIEYIESKR